MLDNSILYQPEGKALSILFSATRSTIAQSWEEGRIPSLATWHNKVWAYYKIARITEIITRHVDEESAPLKLDGFL